MLDGEKTFSFTVYVNDPEYDNTDNPYGSFKLHMYTNMNDMNDTQGSRKGFLDKEVPLEICTGKDFVFRSKKIKYYCPAWDETHFIHGGFSANKFSFMRLVYHACDNSTEADR